MLGVALDSRENWRLNIRKEAQFYIMLVKNGGTSLYKEVTLNAK
jgi:hypothetical protein